MWPFLERGVRQIIHRGHAEWSTFDFYAALRHPQATGMSLWIASRNQHTLGWFCGYPQQNFWNGRMEWFLWGVWTIPLRERRPDDGTREAMIECHEFIRRFAKQNGYHRIVTLSMRELLMMGASVSHRESPHAWRKAHTTYYIPV